MSVNSLSYRNSKRRKIEMTKKTPLTWLIAGLLIAALAIIMSGCSTEKPWAPNPDRPLVLTIVSGPGSADTLAYGASVGFSWVAKGGSGDAQYQYRVGSGSYTALERITSISLIGLAEGAHEITIRAEDSAGSVDSVSRSFTIADALVDLGAPYVWLTEAPAESSFVATGSVIVFAWTGYDSLGDNTNIKFVYDWNGTLSDTTVDRTVSFANVAAANPAIFKVWSVDQSGNVSETYDSIAFFIKTANILYVDDFQWTDQYGFVNNLKEREQKAFYRGVLDGYAFAERDVAVQGNPTRTDLVTGGVPVYSTVIWCGDSDLGTTSGTLADTAVLHTLDFYMQNGGKIIMTGPLTLLDMGNYGNDGPLPAPGMFEFDWLGLDSIAWAYDYWSDFTWAVKDPATSLDLPDSMKIDVGKNGHQVDYAVETPGLRNDANATTEVIYLWGLY